MRKRMLLSQRKKIIALLGTVLIVVSITTVYLYIQQTQKGYAATTFYSDVLFKIENYTDYWKIIVNYTYSNHFHKPWPNPMIPAEGVRYQTSCGYTFGSEGILDNIRYQRDKNINITWIDVGNDYMLWLNDYFIWGKNGNIDYYGKIGTIDNCVFGVDGGKKTHITGIATELLRR